MEGLSGKRHKGTLKDDINVVYLSYGVVSWACKFVKTHQKEHSKWVHFITYNYTLVELIFVKDFKIPSLDSISPFGYCSISLAKLFERIVHTSFLISLLFSLKPVPGFHFHLYHSNKIDQSHQCSESLSFLE